LLLVDHRAEIIIVAASDTEFADPLEQKCAKALVNLIEHDDPAPRSTALAGIAEGGENRPVGGEVEIGVFADDDRVLPTELEADLG
jgi:hypothetical protein